MATTYPLLNCVLCIREREETTVNKTEILLPQKMHICRRLLCFLAVFVNKKYFYGHLFFSHLRSLGYSSAKI